MPALRLQDVMEAGSEAASGDDPQRRFKSGAAANRAHPQPEERGRRSRNEGKTFCVHRVRLQDREEEPPRKAR